VGSTGPNRAQDGPPTMLEALGNSARTPISWTAEDVVVYATAVGADPSTDLDHLDLSRGPSVLPTFLGARVFREGQALNLWDRWAFDPHATFTLACDMSFHRRAPSSNDGGGVGETVATAVWDKGSSALVITETGVTIDRQLVCSVITTMMIQGRGDFGGERGPSRSPAPALDAAVDLDLDLPASSAALYQLVGDHNPHSLDPAFAAEMGLPGPISAGQLLIGAAALTLTATYADGDHGALKRIAVDFAGSHVIGQPLRMLVQADGTDAIDFAVHSGDQPILLGGRAELS
jgi:acyl dehydratase